MAWLATVSLLLALAVLPRPASGMEHSRPYAFRCHRLRRLSAREPPDHREGRSSVGETPCYANQWQARLQNVPVADRELALFMQAARCIPGIATRTLCMI